MAEYYIPIELDNIFEGVVFCDFIHDLHHHINRMEKNSLDDYDCMWLEELIKVIEKRPEYKAYKKKPREV